MTASAMPIQQRSKPPQPPSPTHRSARAKVVLATPAVPSGARARSLRHQVCASRASGLTAVTHPPWAVHSAANAGRSGELAAYWQPGQLTRTRTSYRTPPGTLSTLRLLATPSTQSRSLALAGQTPPSFPLLARPFCGPEESSSMRLRRVTMPTGSTHTTPTPPARSSTCFTRSCGGAGNVRRCRGALTLDSCTT